MRPFHDSPITRTLAARLAESPLKSLEISGRWSTWTEIALTSSVMVGRLNQPRSRSVGRYELLLELGKSPLGSLWLGKADAAGDPELLILRRVQLTRELSANDRDLLADAARWSQGVTGDYVVKSLDVVVEKSELAVASQQHAGETLRSLLRLSNFKRQAIPSSIATRICLDVCRGLENALEHAALSPNGSNFACGGLLPESILVGTDGSTRLLDLGVAATWCRMPSVARHPEVSAYRAPETLAENPTGADDPRADIFTLGTLLWEMLSGGRRLFLGSSHSGVVQRVLTHPIPPVSGGTTQDPPPAALLEAMQRALERDPSRRFPTLSSFTQALLGQSPAEPEAVQEYVNRVAKSALDSRRRVVERALKRSSTRPSALQPRPLAPGATPPGRAHTASPVPREPRAPKVASAPPARAASPSTPPAARPPAAAREGGFAPPLAKPLPLPAQAKLGVSTGSARPPPPPPEPPSSPLSEEVQNPNPGSNVHAADIMRALAVEDAPDSEAAMTVRNPNAPEQAREADRAVSEPPPEAEPSPEALDRAAAKLAAESPQAEADLAAAALGSNPTLGAAAPRAAEPQRWQPRPKQDTSLGLGPDPSDLDANDEVPIVSAPEVASARHPFSEGPPSDQATTTRPLAELVGDVPSPAIPRAPAVPNLKATDAKAAAQRESGTKRVPVPLLAGAAAAALLLVIGLGFAISGGKDEVQTKAAVPESETKEDEGAQGKPASPAQAKPQEPAANEPEPSAAKDAEKKAEDEAKEDEEAEESKDEEAEEQDKSEEEKPETKAPAAPQPVARPRAVAPKPRSKPAPVKRQRKAKRSFIPSGI